MPDVLPLFAVLDLQIEYNRILYPCLPLQVHKLKFDIEVEFTESTPGDQFGIYADVSLADTALDLRHPYNLNEGLKSMVNWSKERQ